MLGEAEYTIKGIYQTRDFPECCAKILTWDHCVSVIEPNDPGCHGFGGIVVFHHDGKDCSEPQRYFPCEDKWYPLVVPQPTSPLFATRTTAGTLEAETLSGGETSMRGPDERAYTYTWVDRFGVESPPAYPSQPKSAYDDETWTLTGFATPPLNAVCVRIYRTSSAFEDGSKVPNPMDTSFQLVEEVPVNNGVWAGVYVDSRRLIDMDHGTLMTEEDCPPPCFEQVVMTEQGYAVGFIGNEIWISERNEPHNWPEKYRHTLPDKIVGIAAFYDFVFVGTTGVPYRMKTVWTKAADESDTQTDILPYKESYPCLSKFALVSTNSGAMYTSFKGVVVLEPGGAAVLASRKREDEDDWYHTYAPNIASFVNGKYFGARMPLGQGFIFDIPDAAEGPLDFGDFVTIDWNPTAVHVGRRGQLIYSVGNDLYEWNAGPAKMTYKWKSKKFRLPGHVAMSVAKVVGNYGPPVKFRIWRGGVLYYERDVNHSSPFRLPPLISGLEWEFSVEGTTEIVEVHMATSITELTEEASL